MYVIRFLRHTLPFFALTLLLVSSAFAQQCKLHRECSTGQLCDGTCQSAEVVLSKSGGKIYWVDQAKGSDSNPGTKVLPWRTISRSTQNGLLKPGDAVIVRAGTYREEIRPQEGGSKSGGHVTWSAYPGEEVIVSGADVINKPNDGYPGWKQQSDGSWRHPWVWTPQRAEGSFNADRRRELFVDNGKMMMPVGGETRPSLKAGEFWVEGSDSKPTAVYLKTHDGSSPTKRLMEVGQRDQLFYSYGEGSHQCGEVERGYYRLIGFKFTHGTSRRQRMVVCPGRYNGRVESVEASWNNGGGIKISGEGHVVRGAIAQNNGIEGIGGTLCNNCIVEYSEIRNNNWMWTQVHNTSHGGGGKWTRNTNTHLRYNTVENNHGSGIWLDEYNYGNRIYGNRVHGNLKQGIMIEKHSNANLIYNNVVTGTKYFSSIWNGIGVSISVSDSNLVAFNTIIGNEGSGVRIGGDNRGDAFGNAVYNNLIYHNITAENWIGENLREIMILGSGPNNGRSGWDRVKSTRVDGNAYTHRADDAGANGYRAVFMMSPSCASGCGNLYSNEIAEWATPDGFDVNGLVTLASVQTIVNTSDYDDGWKLAPTSELIGKAVKLPADFPAIETDFFGNERPATGADVGAHEFIGGLKTAPGTTIGEAGTVRAEQAHASQWHRVSFKNSYVDPVVVMGPVSYNGSEPVTLRVRDVTQTGFEFLVDEWDYLDGAHTEESISYLVVEKGVHRLLDGSVLEAGTEQRVDHDWTKVNLSDWFSKRPVVLTQPVTWHGSQSIKTRNQKVSVSGFEVRLQEEENNDGRHADETVAYVAIEPTSISSKLFAASTGHNVGDDWHALAFASIPDPAFLADMQSYAGSDPAGLRIRSIAPNGAEVMVEEEQSFDAEMGHAKEDVGYVVLASGNLEGEALVGLSAKGSSISTPEHVASDLPSGFELGQNYPNPFNPTTTIRYALPVASDVRLEVFDMTGRRVRVLVDASRSAGWHEATFHAENLASGVYLYRIEAGAFVDLGRLVLMK